MLLTSHMHLRRLLLSSWRRSSRKLWLLLHHPRWHARKELHLLEAWWGPHVTAIVGMAFPSDTLLIMPCFVVAVPGVPLRMATHCSRVHARVSRCVCWPSWWQIEVVDRHWRRHGLALPLMLQLQPDRPRYQCACTLTHAVSNKLCVCTNPQQSECM